MESLSDFLRKRIDEDEAIARAADKARWFPEHKSISFETHDNVGDWDLVGWVEADTRANADHIARWDPARVLRECAAHRQIVGRHTPSSECNNRGCRVAGRSGLHCDYDEEPAPCPDLRDLASVYADHPDYDPEWA